MPTNQRSPLFMPQLPSLALAALLLSAVAAVLLLRPATRAAKAGAQPACVFPPANLISWYPGNGNGNDIQSSFNGALQAGVTFAPGKVAQAFRFDGNSSVVVTHNPGLNPANFTLDAWVFPTLLDGDVEIILNKENNPFRPNTVQYELGIRGNATPGGAIPVGNFCFFIGNLVGLPDQYANWVDGGAPVPLNTWTHVALTFDGATARAYVNGALTRAVTNLSGNVANSTGPLKLGSRSALANNPGAPFNGLLDELEIFSRALAQAELQAIVNAGSAGKCQPAVCSRPNFDPPMSYAANIGPAALAAGDFNGDDRLDLATANYDSNTVSVLLNNGSGFNAPLNLSAGLLPQFIATADLNGDGKPDLIVANGGASNVMIYPGNGNGTFGAPSAYTVGNDPRSIAVGDFNNDGRLDLATANVNAGTVSLLINNGAGGFVAASSVNMAEGTRFVVAADFNADGRLDLAAVNRAAGTVGIALGNGNGTFNAPVFYTVGAHPQGLTTGDFNSDGYLDLAVSNTASNNVSVILNNGNGTFGVVVSYQLINNSVPASLIAADFNSDGKLDLATSNYDSASLSVLLGNGLGSFVSFNNFSTGKQPQHLTPGDFNNDGRLDVATSNLNGGSVTVLINNCAAVPLNTPPVITLAGSGVLTRQQGSAGAVATLATVNDAETIPNNLGVTANAPNGILVTNLNNNNGTVTANVTAGCNAAPGTNSVLLVVTDGNQATNTANLTVNVTTNTPPALGAYPLPAPLKVGDNLTLQPATPPSDNGTLTNVTINAANFTGTLAVNPITGVVTISNARPAGAYNLVITATDNCGATATQNIPLSVGKLGVNVALTVAPGTYITGQPITLTASVTSAGTGGGAPSGIVTFFDGNTMIGTVTLNTANQASLTVATLAAGTHQITAVYGGDANFSAASSAALVISIARTAVNVSAASFFGEALAAEEIVAAFGTNLATTVQAATSLPLPVNLAGTIVRVRDSAGAERLAPLFFVSPGQVNYLLPAGTANGAATVTLISGDGSISIGVVQINPVAPGLFAANTNGRGVVAALALRVRADGAQTFELVARYDNALAAYISVPIDLGPEGEQVFLVCFGTGLRGHTGLANVVANLGNTRADVVYAGAQGDLAGLDQVNIRIPRTLAGRGELDVALTVNGRAANLVRINIK